MTPKLPDRVCLALLRAVNVGGHNKVPMAALRTALAAAGYSKVTTYLQSGNVILASADSPDAVARKVESVVAEQFNVRSNCVVVSLRELESIITACPLLDDATDHSRLLVTITATPIGRPQLAMWDPTAIDPQRIAIGPRAVYAWCPDGIRTVQPKLAPIEKKWGITATGRNWKTVTALRDLAAEIARDS